MQKRSCEEMFPLSKKQHLEEAFSDEYSNTCANELNMQCLGFSNVLDANGDSTCTNNLRVTEPTITMEQETINSDDASFPDSSCEFMSAKDYLNNFFKELEFSNIATQARNLDESLQKPLDSIPNVNEELQNIIPTTTIDPVNVTPHNMEIKSHKTFLFQQELSDFIYLALRLHNRQYYVHIREFNRNVFTKEEIPSKNGIHMDINSWYEFQYKIFAFNLRYTSSSFIANNTILVLSYDYTTMRIKNLRNYSHIELNEQQLEKLKEVAYDLNKKLIYDMYNKQLPYLIKNKCAISNIPPEKEHDLITKLSLSIEKNLLTILNRIYECNGCIFKQHSQSLHQCFLFNNREKFQQLGDMMLMLVDLDFVSSMFYNEVYCISQHFLCSINVETIKNALFKSELINKI